MLYCDHYLTNHIFFDRRHSVQRWNWVTRSRVTGSPGQQFYLAGSGRVTGQCHETMTRLWPRFFLWTFSTEFAFYHQCRCRGQLVNKMLFAKQVSYSINLTHWHGGERIVAKCRCDLRLRSKSLSFRHLQPSRTPFLNCRQNSSQRSSKSVKFIRGSIGLGCTDFKNEIIRPTG